MKGSAWSLSFCVGQDGQSIGNPATFLYQSMPIFYILSAIDIKQQESLSALETFCSQTSTLGPKTLLLNI